MNKKILLVGTLILETFALSVASKPLVADTTYRGPVNLEVADLGLKFKLPTGWQGVAPSSGEAFVATNNSTIQLFLLPMTMPVSVLEKEFEQGSEVSPGIFLQPVTRPKKMRDGSLFGQFQLDGNPDVQVFAQAKPIKRRNPVMILALCAKQVSSGDCENAVRTFSKSIRSAKKATQEKPSGQLAKFLSNRKLYRFYNGSGYSEKTTLTLCADGRFYRSFGASSVSQLGTGAASDSNAGRWKVVNNSLNLQERNGNQRFLRIQLEGTKLFLDGERWLKESFTCR